MYNDEFVKLANANGWRAIKCETCRGNGIAVKRDANSTTAKTIEDPCSFCEGTGRQWQYGNSTYHLTERELASRLNVTLGSND